MLDCHLDLTLDPVEDAEPAGVRNQAPQVSNQLRDGPLATGQVGVAWGAVVGGGFWEVSVPPSGGLWG